ncbi:MAG: DNA methyltransferase [Planctomycetota bacterium]
MDRRRTRARRAGRARATRPLRGAAHGRPGGGAARPVPRRGRGRRRGRRARAARRSGHEARRPLGAWRPPAALWRLGERSRPRSSARWCARPPAQHRPALQREGRTPEQQRDPRRALVVLGAREAPPPGAGPRASPGEVQAHDAQDAREGPAARERLRTRRGLRRDAPRLVRERLARPVPGRAAYIWGGYANVFNYPPALREAGLYFSQTIIWDKQHPVLTRKDFMGAHEWCFYCWKEGAAHVFYGPANVPDLWVVKKVTPQKMVHLTEKPVELAARALQYSSKSGENVLDLFGGSGSTLMACEQLGRHGFLMELDPAYCDVIVQRWEAATGRKGHSTCARATPSPRPRSGGRRHRDPSRPAPDAHGQATAPRLVARERAPWRAAPEARAAPCAVLARQGRQDRVRRGCASAR